MKNKGFTLIELLAVIVILAILALIAIPIVINIISDSRESAHKNSIHAYGRSVENAIATWQSENDGEPPTHIYEYDIKTSGEKVVCDPEIKGIDSDDGIELTDCMVVDSKGKQKSKAKYNYVNGKLVRIDQKEESDSNNNDLDDSNNNNNTNNNTNNSNGSTNTNNTNNDPFKIGKKIELHEDYYRIIGVGDDYLTLLKQEPLTVEEVNRNAIGLDGENHVNRNTRHIKGMAEDWFDYGYGGVAYYTSDRCGAGYLYSGCKNNYNSSDIKYIVDKWASVTFEDNELKMVNGYKARLITYDEFVDNLGCSANNCRLSQYKWIYSNKYLYWTMTPNKDDFIRVWYVDTWGYLNNNDMSSISKGVTAESGTVRPVINVYKSVIN